GHARKALAGGLAPRRADHERADPRCEPGSGFDYERTGIDGILRLTRTFATEGIGGDPVRDEHDEARPDRRRGSNFFERVAVGVMRGGAPVRPLALKGLLYLPALRRVRRGQLLDTHGGL